MSNQQHIEVGDIDFFTKYLEAFGVQKTEAKSAIESLYGLLVVVNKYIPKDRAVLVNAQGKVVKVFKLKTWATKRDKQALTPPITNEDNLK